MNRPFTPKKCIWLRLFPVVAIVLFALSNPAGAAIHPDTFAVVANQDINGASVVDLTVSPHISRPIALSAPIVKAFDVAITPDGTRALITGVDEGIVCVIDLTQNPACEIARVAVGGQAAQIDITPDGKRAVVGNMNSRNVTILDIASDSPTIITQIPVGYKTNLGWTSPYAVGITPDGQYAIVSGGDFENPRYVGKAYVINLNTYKIDANITIGRYAIGMRIDPTGKTAVITTIDDVDASGNGRVSILDLTTTPFSLKTKVVVGMTPNSTPAISKDGRYALVPNSASNNVSIIDLTLTNPAVVATLPVGTDPRGAAIIPDPDENRVLVASKYSGTISEIDLNTLSRVEVFPTNSSPNHLALFKKVNKKPVANAGGDQTVDEGTVVTLNGAGSTDPENQSLTYQWTRIAGEQVSLSDSTSATPSFTAPWVGREGSTLTFELVVSDGKLSSDPSVVNIMVRNVNHPPVPQASDQSVEEGSDVILDGSWSYDLDGDTLSFTWMQTGGPEVSLSDPTIAQPSFIAPFVGSTGATLTFELIVSDGLVSSTATVSVFVENVNHPPSANAGLDQTVNQGSLVTLDGTGSTDPDNDPLTYTWTQISGPLVTLSDKNYKAPTFTAPNVGPGGDTLVFSLVVNDGVVNSEPGQVSIKVQHTNDPPNGEYATPKPNLLWPPNHKLVPVEIVGVTDLNNDNVTITITGVTQDEPVNGLGDGDTGPDAVIQGSKVLLRAERAGSGNGRVYRVAFIATDSNGGTCSGTVTVGVPRDRKDLTCVDDGQVYVSTQP